MKELDLDALLQPVSAESPSGEDLEYDSDFHAMAQAAQGSPGRYMSERLVVPAEDPDWSAVRALSLGLLVRSKDLRSAVLLARAQLHTDGLAGLSEGLRILRGLVEEFWDSLHPQLDPKENLDPSIRLNALLALCEPDTMLRPLRAIPLIRSRAFGVVTYRDIEVADGKATAAQGAPVRDSAAIAGAFQDCDLDELNRAALAASAALAEAHALGDALATHVAPQSMLDLVPLTGLLAAIHGVLQARRDERVPASDTEGATQAETDPSDSGDGSPLSMRPGASTQISSREDVVRALDKLCDYYARHEPSSPVPLLLKRARRLVNGSFVDIVRDLAPDALPQIQSVCGTETGT